MEKYGHLKYAIEHFSADWEYTDDEYEETFLSFIKAESEYAKKIKSELLEALQDPNWSWVKIGCETNFIGSDDTEESVWLTIKVLIWDVLFPNEEPPTNKLV